MNVMLLAAGLGKRLRPLTESTAKPAVELLGVPMIAYPLFQLQQFCSVNSLVIESLVVNLHHAPETLVTALARFFDLPPEKLTDPFFNFKKQGAYEVAQSEFRRHTDFAKRLVFSFEHPEILDSGGGIKQAAAFLSGGATANFLVINADSVFFVQQRTYAKFYSTVKVAPENCHFLCSEFTYDPSKVGALWCDSSGVIKSFGKVSNLPGDLSVRDRSSLTPVHNIGFYFLPESTLRKFPEGPSRLFDVLARGLTSQCLTDPSIMWFETGEIQGFNMVESRLRKLAKDSDSATGVQIKAIKDFWFGS